MGYIFIMMRYLFSVQNFLLCNPLSLSPSILLFPLSLSSAPLQCRTFACLKASELLAGTIDPFSQPCDYFLFTCGSPGVTRGRQRGKGIAHHSNGGSGEKMKTKKRQNKRVKTEDDALVYRLSDRETLLLQSIKEILGKGSDNAFSQASTVLF